MGHVVVAMVADHVTLFEHAHEQLEVSAHLVLSEVTGVDLGIEVDGVGEDKEGQGNSGGFGEVEDGPGVLVGAVVECYVDKLLLNVGRCTVSRFEGKQVGLSALFTGPKLGSENDEQ